MAEEYRRINRRDEQRRRKRQKRRRVKRLMRFCVALVLVVLICVVAWAVIGDKRAPKLVLSDVTINAGESVDYGDFIESVDDRSEVTTGYKGDAPDVTLIGTQDVMISAVDEKGNEAVENTHLTVNEVATEGEFTVFAPTVYAAGDFVNVSNAADTPAETTDENAEADAANAETGVESNVTYEYLYEPDFSKIGEHIAVIIAVDAGGSSTQHAVKLNVVEDTEPPVFESADDFTVNLGESIAYKQQVTVTDNSGNVELKVDSSQVNPTAEGTYPVTYTATDAAGNSSTASLNVTLVEMSADEQALNARVDQILSEILTDDMSQRDKAYAIFTYVKNHVGYYDSSMKDSYIDAATQALDTHQGDCFVYFAISKVMLTRAGIKNMDIERIPEGDELHYWNLVDVEDGHGWYHFDTTPRIDHPAPQGDRPAFFLWTDEEIKAYSDAHDNCHNYDRSKYPEIL